jgi:hypothetical protein
MTRRTIEKRRRGIFGWITLTMFWAWNGIMALLTYRALPRFIEMVSTLPSGDSFEAGVAIVFMLILIVWALVSASLYLLVRSTRGRREDVEVETR